MANNKGFTLIELMIVIVIISAIAGLFVSNLSSYNSLLVRMELEKLQGVCLYLQKCAQSCQQKQMLEFDICNNSYSFKGQREQLPSQVHFNIKQGVKGPPSCPKYVLDKPITFEQERIIFYPDGIVQSGAIYLTDEKNECLYALSNGVGHVSFLRKYRYDNGWNLIS